MPSIRRTLFLALPVAGALAGQHDCSAIVTDGKKFNLKKLAGPKTVHQILPPYPGVTNTTFTVDICAPLREESSVPEKERCSGGTYVCAKEYVRTDGVELLYRVKDIAGQYTTSHGRALDPKYTRLKGSADHANADREGLRVELNGGKFPKEKTGRKQKAVFEFICDHDLDGNEGFGNEAEGDAEALMVLGMAVNGTALQRREGEEKDGDDGGDDDDDDDEKPMPNPYDEGKSLQFDSYKIEGSDEVEVLRLTWKTKYACEDSAGKGDEDDSPDGGKRPGSWGFFTWFLIIAFLLAATYIIFGSWLNYNRYGARGWDLIPHGDTIRDFPYLVKDWGQNAADRLRGGPAGRGGYSAV
ncbi:hypothetical protein K431DRAFT_280417 [Polychaeton citri CBS 116435]|uniref:Autophagy-related protein 27 n=1 Tax=Polychaeton citri CBS 116435 TaxID=1314669 RepID=A0A9P4QH63_9PEZI|nr:hypothetical protein K431DRAFT_280417 [Polychaeton citri CBS 116435]